MNTDNSAKITCKWYHCIQLIRSRTKCDMTLLKRQSWHMPKCDMTLLKRLSRHMPKCDMTLFKRQSLHMNRGHDTIQKAIMTHAKMGWETHSEKWLFTLSWESTQKKQCDVGSWNTRWSVTLKMWTTALFTYFQCGTSHLKKLMKVNRKCDNFT